MPNLYLIPNWFYTFGIGLEFVFAVAAFLVSVYAYRVYKTYENREIGLFSLGFFFIGLAYLLKAYMNYIVLSNVNSAVRELSLEKLSMLQLFGIYSYLILFIAGLATLAYISFKINDKRVLSLMLIISVFFVLLGENIYFSFNALSIILLLYIVMYYYKVYNERKSKRSLLVFIAFICLLLSSLVFIFHASYYFNYVVSHILELVSYVLIVISLMSTLRR